MLTISLCNVNSFVVVVVLCLFDQYCSIKYGTLRERKLYKIIAVDDQMQNINIFKMRSGRDESSKMGK